MFHHQQPAEDEITYYSGLFATKDGDVTNEAGFEVDWEDGEYQATHSYGIFLLGPRPGAPPPGEAEIRRVLKQLGCTIPTEQRYTYPDEDWARSGVDGENWVGLTSLHLDVALPTCMTAKQGRRFHNAIERWKKEFGARISVGMRGDEG